jgi:ABC-type transporter Mla MlaB component
MREKMLRINFTETSSEERWTLHGRLTAPWVRVLRACWKKNHRSRKERACIVDLNEITTIDKSGERFLLLLMREGAQCIATGVYIKHVLKQLTTKGKGSILKRLAGFFLAAVIAVFAVRFGAECIATGISSNMVLSN